MQSDKPVLMEGSTERAVQDGYVYATNWQEEPKILFRFDRKGASKVADLIGWGVAKITPDPTGRYLYYVPPQHGGGEKLGTPIIQYEIKTGKTKVLAFLSEVFREKFGRDLGGTLCHDIDASGSQLFIGWQYVQPYPPPERGAPAAWPITALTVVHIPESER